MPEDIGLFEAIYTMRAIRRQRPDLPVSDADIRKIIEAGTQAPNGGNNQPWRFIVVRDQAIKDELGRLYRDSVTQVLVAPDVSGTKAEWYLGEHLAESPAIIMVYAIPSNDHQGNPRPLSEGAAGRQFVPAVQNMLLACRGLGLGSNFTSAIGAFHGAEVDALLGVPDGAVFIVMLPIGYPQGKHGPKTRRPVEEVTFADRWGEPIRFEAGATAGGGA